MKLQEKMYEICQPLFHSSRPEDTIPVLEKMVQTWPDFTFAHNDLGVLYYQAGKKEEALTHYETAARLQPDSITIQKNLGDFYYVEQGRVEDALECYANILKANPNDMEALLIAGHICVSLQQFDKAKSYYQRVLDIQPWNAEVRENLNKLENTSPSAAPTDAPDEIYQKIQEKVKQNQTHEAIQDLTRLLQQCPDYAVAHNDLGVLYYNAGEKEKAKSHYQKALENEPENTIFQKNLADYYCVEEGRTEEALQTYVNILRKDPEDLEVLFATAQICEGLKRDEDAKVFYSRILEIEPWNTHAMQRLDAMN